MPLPDLELALRTARLAVERGGAAALTHWSDQVDFERKSDGSPVTAGDQASERVIIETIREAFPEHSMLTEESGVHDGDPETRWIVDPLDGTKGFTRGGFFWGPLIALEHEGEIVAGGMGLPALGRYYWAAKGLGAFLHEPQGGERRLRVSQRAAWGESTLSLGELQRLMSDLPGPTAELMQRAGTVRAYGDAASCTLVLEGRAELWIEHGVQPWDLGPFPILLAEAGGRFSDFEGGCSIEGGSGLGSNGGPLHDVAFEILRQR